MDALTILIPLFTAMLGYAVGYFVKKSEYERQRRDELADRKTNKLSKFRDSKIEDVQAFIHTYNDMTLTLSVFEGVIAKEKVNDMSIRGFDKIAEEMNKVQRYAGSFIALNDPILSPLSVAVVQTYSAEYVNALDLVEMIGKEQEFDEETVLKRVGDVQSSLISVLSVMQRRLNELAQTGE